MNINHAIISGNLTRDPSTKFLANEKCVCTITIACSRKFKNGKGEAAEEVLFLDCVSFGKTAEVIGKYCVKGKPVILEGAIKMDAWDDKETGKKRSKIVLQVEKMHFVPDGKRETEGRPETPKPVDAPVGTSNSGVDEPPF